jgi:hypothetical protein
VCLNTRITGRGSPQEVLTPEVLERTYGAPLEVLQHAGVPIVVDPTELVTIGRARPRVSVTRSQKGAPWAG